MARVNAAGQIEVYDVTTDTYRPIKLSDVKQGEQMIAAFGRWLTVSRALDELYLKLAQGKVSFEEFDNATEGLNR